MRNGESSVHDESIKSIPQIVAAFDGVGNISNSESLRR